MSWKNEHSVLNRESCCDDGYELINEGNSSNMLLRITHNELSNKRLINSISKGKLDDEMIVVSADNREGNVFKTVRLPVWQRRDNSGKR